MQAALAAILMTGVVQASPFEQAKTDGQEVIIVDQAHAAGSFHPAVQPRHDHGFVDSTPGSIWPLPQIRYSSRLGFRPQKRWNPNSHDGYYFHRTYNYRVEFDYPWHAAPRAYRGGYPQGIVLRGGVPVTPPSVKSDGVYSAEPLPTSVASPR